MIYSAHHLVSFFMRLFIYGSCYVKDKID